MRRPGINSSFSEGFGNASAAFSARESLPRLETEAGAVLHVDQRGEPLIATGDKTHRIVALDFTKGALVVIMVFYHWLNYFVSTGGSFYKYLRFLTPSFIFITGFLISTVYLAKYQITDSRLPRRLLYRGLKLLGIFIVLNLATNLLLPGSSGKVPDNWSPANIVSLYLTGGTAARRAPAFSVLVPISYLLLLSAGLCVVSRLYKYTFHVACVLLLVCVLVLELNGVTNGYLELLGIGLLGVSLGHFPMGTTNAVRHPGLLLSAYASYVCAITIWNEVYPLQIVGVCLSLAIIYKVGNESQRFGRIGRVVLLIGKYSLFGYVAQIAILKMVQSGLQHVDLGRGTVGVSFFGGLALTVLSVELLDWARARVPAVNRLYSTVFS